MLDVVRTTSKEGNKADEEADVAKRNKNAFNLKENIGHILNKMERERESDKSKKIPAGFHDFVNSPMFRDLLEAMLDYTRELFRLENK